jgi:hypothetical protein
MKMNQINKRLKPIERLQQAYQNYVDNMDKWKTYAVTLKSNHEEHTHRMMAFNPEHLMLEIGQMWHLDNMELTGISYEEVGKYKVTDRQQADEVEYYKRKGLIEMAFEHVKDKVENAPEHNEWIEELSVILNNGISNFTFQQALSIWNVWDYDVEYIDRME